MSDFARDGDLTSALTVADARHERLAEILDRYLSDLEGGGIPPDVDQLIAEHPDLAEEIHSYVASLQTLHQMTTGLRPPSTTPPSAPAPQASLKRLGDYEIIREIGRGGMGIVYEARQLSLNRQVALKVLPFAAVLDERHIARFRTEAQAAAQLHHPNIVPVHAVGQERGVHYFAMQFVAGRSLECAIAELRRSAATGEAGEAASPSRPPVDRAAETALETAFSTKVSTRNRNYCRSVARLGVQAADALQHAHEFGVVHRDIKPSNLLLDRDGKLWITDFGLARIQTGSGVTVSGDVVGTARYMSPEQAAGRTALVDARTDVYALGATLYELLTLKPAHRGADRQEIMRYIESREPAPPRSLNPAVPIDLETIVLRALAKSRDERYATAQELADDLRRFLAGQPTQARRPTLVDRGAKWALRHRKAVSFTALFLVLLSLVSATAAVMIARGQDRTEEALIAAKDNLARAEHYFRQAKEMVDRYGGGLSKELANLPGSQPLRHALLTRTLDYYRKFLADAAGHPELTAELASTCLQSATIAESLGERDEALKMCRQSIALFDDLSKKSPNDVKLPTQLARAYNGLGLLLAAQGDVGQALDAYDRAIAVHRRVAPRRQQEPEFLRSLAECLSNQGLLRGQLGEKAAARSALSSSIELLERAVARDDAALEPQHELAIGHNNLSFVERGDDWERSERSCVAAIEILERLVKADPASLTYRSDLALCYNNHGAIQGHRSAWADACESYRRAIGLQRQLERQAPAAVYYRRDLAISLNNLGQALENSGDFEAAIGSFDDAESLVALLVEDYPQELAFRSLCGGVFNNRAMVLETVRRLDEALAGYKRAIEHQQVAYERAPQVAEYREFLSKHYFNYGRALRKAGKVDEAIAVALERRQLWPDHGEHLGRVAVELAEAAVQLRHEGDAANPGAASQAEAQALDALRSAGAAGADVEALRREEAFRLLQSDEDLAKLTGSQAGPPEETAPPRVE